MKRTKKMLLLMLVLVLCTGGYYGMQLMNQETASVSEETGTFALDDHTADQLSGLSWTDGEESFAFSLSDGVWTVTGDAAFPLNQEDVQAMADELLALKGNRQLDGASDLSIYGLSEPSFSVTASWSDGTSTVYSQGAETPFADGYYVSSGKANTVYTAEDSIADIFDTTMNDLAVLETIPSVAGATRLTVGSTLDITKEETSRTVNASELWYDTLTGAALDPDAADALVTAAAGIAWSELAEPTASDAELASFGLDEASAAAITLYEGENAVLKLLIGNQRDDGDYYARLPGSFMVYTVDGDSISSLLSASAAAMPSTVILEMTADAVHSAVFTAGEYSYTWSSAAAGENTEAAESPEFSDASETPDPGEELWASLLALSSDSRIDSASGAVLLTVEVTSADEQTVTLTFSEYDAAHYAVTLSDRCLLVDAGAVDAIIRTLRAIK